MTVRLKLDFHGLWLGIYTKTELDTYLHRSGLRERWRRRVCGEPIRVTTSDPRKAMLGECGHCFNGTRNESGRQRHARE